MYTYFLTICLVLIDLNIPTESDDDKAMPWGVHFFLILAN